MWHHGWTSSELTVIRKDMKCIKKLSDRWSMLTERETRKMVKTLLTPWREQEREGGSEGEDRRERGRRKDEARQVWMKNSWSIHEDRFFSFFLFFFNKRGRDRESIRDRKLRSPSSWKPLSLHQTTLYPTISYEIVLVFSLSLSDIFTASLHSWSLVLFNALTGIEKCKRPPSKLQQELVFLGVRLRRTKGSPSRCLSLSLFCSLVQQDLLLLAFPPLSAFSPKSMLWEKGRNFRSENLNQKYTFRVSLFRISLSLFQWSSLSLFQWSSFCLSTEFRGLLATSLRKSCFNLKNVSFSPLDGQFMWKEKRWENGCERKIEPWPDGHDVP